MFSISLGLNGTAYFKLSANPTTGFMWIVD